MNRSDVNVRQLLKDLGKATMRGVRKCPKCATYNGTRGNTCKNKTCNYVFKSSPSSTLSPMMGSNNKPLFGTKKVMRNSLEAIRIVTGSSSSNIFSVRVRDRGPDYRGFVEVPIIQGLDGTSDPSLDASFIAETTARCFMDVCGCHKVVLPIDQSDASGITNPAQIHSDGHATTNITLTIIESCIHIKHAVKCSADASPLTLKNSVLNMLPITEVIRDEIWTLARDTPGPLVQRVSKLSMVVKCKVSNKHSLGYLHCSFAESASSKGNGDVQRTNVHHKFSCHCKAFKTFKSTNNQTVNVNDSNRTLSCESLQNQVQNDGIIQKKCVHYYACICAFASDSNLMSEFSYFVSRELPHLLVNTELTDTSSVLSHDVLTRESPSPKRVKKDDTEIVVINTRKLIDRGILSESDISMSFINWLSCVTELINQTMHYQLNGHPEALIFKIPQGFFDCLQQRIATGLRKKRLPNITTVFTRKDCPPLGTFTKYIYFITNIIHVKQIFDTPHVSLEITQNFTQNRDGSYDYLNSKSGSGISNTLPSIDTSPLLSSANNILIKPSELKTYLKVGLMSPDQKEAIPFIIEWIPDILPKCHVGELRIQFQFGHLKNGRIEKRD